MHGFKHRTQRLQHDYGNVKQHARAGDYMAQLKNNMFEARVIAFETSPNRVLSRHAYKNALYATRRLVSSGFLLRKAATEEWQRVMVTKIDELLLTARENAMVKSFDVSIAQDVYALLSLYLGLHAAPEEPEEVAQASPFVKTTSFVVEKVQEGRRRIARRRSNGIGLSRPGFMQFSTSLMNLNKDSDDKKDQGKIRSCASFSDLAAEFVEEETPVFVT